jgi:hypothetical protein
MRDSMEKLHITQDDYGYWMLSLEKEDGELTLLAYQFENPDHLIENAREMVADGQLEAAIVVDPARPPAVAPEARAATPYRRPAPKRAGV